MRKERIEPTERKKLTNRVRQKRIAEVAALLKDGKRKLEGDQRLEAALMVSQLYQEVRKAKLTAEVAPTCENEKVSGEGAFRIARWKLHDRIEVVNAEARSKYPKHGPTPLKNAATYLRLVAALAGIIGRDRDETQIELLERAGLAKEIGPVTEDEANPALRLSRLLQDLVRDLAVSLDIQSLWTEAESVSAGWDPYGAPVAMALEESIESDAFRVSPAGRFYPVLFDGGVPPFPAIRIARIPFGQLRGEFVVRTSFDDEHGTVAPGVVTAYWDLHLAIAPTGPLSASAYFMRSCLDELRLEAPISKTLVAKSTLSDFEYFSNEMTWSGQNSFDEPCCNDVNFSESFELAWSRLVKQNKSPASSSFFRPSRSANQLDGDETPTDTYEYLRFNPVSPRSVQDWLIDDLSYGDGPDHRKSEPVNLPWETRRTLWSPRGTLAWHVEAGLHDGSIEAALRDWVADYRASLADFTGSRRAQAEADEQALRERWRARREAEALQTATKEGSS